MRMHEEPLLGFPIGPEPGRHVGVAELADALA